MSVLPDKTEDLIAFCESHLTSWTAAPAASIGLTAAQLTSFTSVTKAARDSLTANTNARNAAKASTTTLRTNVTNARAMAADLVRVIKGFAELQANPGSVYGLAQIPQPAAPTPATAPGKPTNVSVSLEASGAVTISFEATNASASSGGFFQVMRKLPGQTAFVNFTQMPGTTARDRRITFTDFTVPTSAAANGVQYIMQGRRGVNVGEASDAITVQFGVDGGGATIVTATGADLRMAA
jgi:hypothetical protein